MKHPLLQDGITISSDARDQQYDRYVNGFDCISDFMIGIVIL